MIKEITETLIGILSRFKGVNYVKYTGDDLINQQQNNKTLQAYIDDVQLHQFNITNDICKVEYQIYILVNKFLIILKKHELSLIPLDATMGDSVLIIVVRNLLSMFCISLLRPDFW